MLKPSPPRFPSHLLLPHARMPIHHTHDDKARSNTLILFDSPWSLLISCWNLSMATSCADRCCSNATFFCSSSCRNCANPQSVSSPNIDVAQPLYTRSTHHHCNTPGYSSQTRGGCFPYDQDFPFRGEFCIPPAAHCAPRMHSYLDSAAAPAFRFWAPVSRR